MYCGGALEACDSGDELIDCPACNTQMTKETLLGVTIDECSECNGRWFDRNELKELLDAKKKAGPENPVMSNRDPEQVARFSMTQTKVEYRKCPRCQKTMLRKNYETISGVMIDTCPVDGVFLDGEEFNQLRAFVETAGRERALVMEERERNWHDEQMKVVEQIKSQRAARMTGKYSYHVDGLSQLTDVAGAFLDVVGVIVDDFD